MISKLNVPRLKDEEDTLINTLRLKKKYHCIIL